MASVPQKRGLLGQVADWIGQTAVGRAFAWAGRNSEQTFMGQLAAMGREMVKDVRGTFHQVMFGRGEGHGEPGAPLVPTQAIVTGQTLGQPTAKLTLNDLRGYAKERTQEAAKAMEQPSKQRGGMER